MNVDVEMRKEGKILLSMLNRGSDYLKSTIKRLSPEQIRLVDESYYRGYGKSFLRLLNEDEVHLLSFLIKQGCDPTRVDRESGDSLLHSFVSPEFQGILLCHCDVNSQNKKGQTPLHLATKTRNEEYIAMLLRENADSSILDHKGRSVFLYEQWYGASASS